MRIQYCQCCKINHEQGKGHIYSQRHVKKLQEWAERQKKRVDDCILLAQHGYANASVSTHSFWCAFCGEEILDDAPMIIKNCLNHLCSKKHIDTVYEFFRNNGTNNKLINQKWYFVGEPFRDEYIENCKSWIYHGKVSESLFSSSAPVCGPSPAPVIITKQAQVIKPKTALERKLEDYSYDSLIRGPLQSDTYLQGKEFSTLQSASGILQNPSGFTETGKRVWGGGIVKLSKKEWVDWPIDLIFLHLYQRQSSVQKLIQEAEVRQRKEEATKQKEAVLRMHTVGATAPGLTCICKQQSNTEIGNIHSMALPPWLSPGENSKAMRQWKKQMEYEERYNKRFKALDVGVVRGKKAKEDWLPNFGGVWSTGPRQQNRNSFRAEKMGDKKEVGSGSTITELSSFVNSGGNGMTEEEKRLILESSKKKVFEKVQLRMKNVQSFVF